jgi:type II restriction/modification system DNA methylase subunit YeeA
MNKTAIKNFAIEARKKLISEITYRAGLIGITKNGIAEPVHKANGIEMYDIGASDPYTIKGEQLKQRKSLASRVKGKGFDNVIEEVAYTWFNRIIAVRFMEVNDYLPTRVRVLSSETAGKIEPDIVTDAPNIDLGFTSVDIDEILQLKHDNKLDELFRMLFIKQCNALNSILPELFEKTSDYTELLLAISFTNEDSIVRLLIDSVEEDDFKEQVEIIGWMYQYYNTEPKSKVDAYVKNGVKVVKEDVPAKTQLFTPDWIVRYMVENSLGRLWLEGHPDSDIKAGWKYYLDEAEQKPDVKAQLEKIKEESSRINPEDIRVIDPCMGSGHILVYVFDVLMDLYKSYGYEEREAAKLILQNNIYGLDIDDRAYQFAYIAVMMKAREYSRRILSEGIIPNLCAIQESNMSDIEIKELSDFFIQGVTEIEKPSLKADFEYILEVFRDAKEYGSILDVKVIDFDAIERRIEEIRKGENFDLFDMQYRNLIVEKVVPLVKQAKIMAQRYDVTITNPPYLSSSDMNTKLSDYVKKNYPNTKSDLFAVFIEKGFEWTKNDGFNSMVTMQAWMFLTSYEKFRGNLFSDKTIYNLMQMENNVMPIAFGTCATVFRNSTIKGFIGTYNHINTKDITDKNLPYEFPIKINRNSQVNSENFSSIPGMPVAYWVSDAMRKAFEKGKSLGEVSNPCQGLSTSDNNRFLRIWTEVNISKIGFNYTNSTSAELSLKKWFPFNKGGSYRKWYGNNEYIVNYENNGKEMREVVLKKYPYLNTADFVIKNQQYYFQKGLTWSALTSGSFSIRYFDEGFIFADKGQSLFSEDELRLFLCGFLNSKVSKRILELISPTLDYNCGYVRKMPIIYSEHHKVQIDDLVSENINISKIDWDSFETSWDFKGNPLVHRISECKKIQRAFEIWQDFVKKQFIKLKDNEEKLNNIFIEIYGLQGELTPEVEDKDVTIHRVNLERDIRNFISYAVGCMFGRYSLDSDGLSYAGGEWDNSKYKTYIPDADSIIPITDEEYFNDDIVGRFVEFVKVTFGADTLEENLDFIASALGNKGDTSRDIIRQYFIKDFYKDHVKTYQKKPIYWLFDSGKENGFKALIYLHRYNQDTVGRVRVDYLHNTQKAIESAISRADMVIESATNPSQKAKAVKEKEKLVKQLAETRIYDAAIGHIAAQRIAIDLDDGVAVNYAKFQGIEVSSEGKKASKIDLLGKI